MKQSIVTKLWLVLVGIILIILLVLGLILSQLYQDFYYSDQTEQLIKYSGIISEVVLGKGDISEEELETVGKFISARAMVIDKSGLVRACNGAMGMRKGMHLDNEDAQKVLAGERVVKVGYNQDLEQTVLSVAVPIELDKDILGAVFLFKPVASIEANIAEIRKIMLLAALMAIAVATVLAFVLSKTLSKPLVSMEHAAKSMAQGNFDAKLSVQSEDEIGALASSLNYLADKLKMTLQDLHTEKAKLENILSSMSDGVVSFDNEGKIIMHNTFAEEILSNLPQLTATDEWQYAFINTNTLNKVNIIDWQQGEKDYHVTLAPLAQESGVVALFHEVTKEKRLERLRKDFVANVTHELRTPLSLMQGYAEAVIDFGDNVETRNTYAQIIIDEIKRLSVLVNELLQLSKSEEEINKLFKEQTDLSGFINEVVEQYKPVCDKTIPIELEIEPNLPSILIDKGKIRQVLINLLDNACRHSGMAQKISLKAYHVLNGITVSVKDYGVGIPEEDLPYIWDRFYRVDKSRQRNTGGTGLGLAIVKGIIEQHNGKVSVESIPNQFTEFKFFLPLN